MKLRHAFQAFPEVFELMCVLHSSQYRSEDLPFILETFVDGKVVVYGPPSYLSDIGVRRVEIKVGNITIEFHKDTMPGGFSVLPKKIVVSSEGRFLGGVEIRPMSSTSNAENPLHEFFAMDTGDSLGSGYGNFMDSTIVDCFYPDSDYSRSYENYIPFAVQNYVKGLVETNTSVESASL